MTSRLASLRDAAGRLVRSAHDRQDGFTLLDTLLGLTLAAILMLGIGGVMRSGLAAVRIAGDAVRGDDDALTLTTYLTRDVHAAAADTQLASVTGGGNGLTLGLADVAGARFVTVTYAYDPAAGTVTRTLTAPGTSTAITVARNLATGYTPVFEYCSPVALTITPAITANAAAAQTVAVSSTANVKPGLELTVDSGASAETVVVTSVGAGTIMAVFSKSHAAGVAASNACLSVAANVPFNVNGQLVVRTLRVGTHLRAS